MDYLKILTHPTEDHIAFRAKPLKVTSIPCAACPEFLIETEFNGHYVQLCDNFRCRLFKQPQGISLIPAKAKPLIKVDYPSFKRFLAKREKIRKERYALAKSYGLDCYTAQKLRDRTIAEIEEYAKNN